jgi:hypothetical protein
VSKVWGVVSMSNCYHFSPNCTHIIHRDKLETPCYTVEYADEQHAFEIGHLRACEHCVGAKTVTDEEIGMVQLTVEQIATLKAVRKLYSETNKPLTLKQIAGERKRKITGTHRIVDMLVRKNILLKRKSKTGINAMPGSILPTAAVNRILDRLA